MVKFVYQGGQTRTEHSSTSFDDRGKPNHVDETQGVEMPDSTVAFGIKFIVGQPVDVTADKFASPAQHRHAIQKLQTNPFFKPFAEDAVIVEETPAPKRPVLKASA